MESQSPGTGPEIRGEVQHLPPDRDPAAAAILAARTLRGTVAAGARLLAALRADPSTSLFGLMAGNELVAVYALRKSRLAMELTQLAVAEEMRGQGYGRACLADAKRRSGRWPLVVEADEPTWTFFQTAGFRLVSRHRGDDGATRIRLAWHARSAPLEVRGRQ